MPPIVAGYKIDFSDDSNFVTIVGTTKPTRFEMQSAYDLGLYCADRGLIVVSGLADGVDTCAHLGALASKKEGPKTVAIVSTAYRQNHYPHSNNELAKRIIRNGAVIYPYGTVKAPWTNEKFGPNQKRLVERDVLQASLVSQIVAVSENSKISGGTRWALNYGKHLNKELFQKNPNFEGLLENPLFVVEKDLIPWSMELDWQAVTEELKSGDYSHMPI